MQNRIRMRIESRLLSPCMVKLALLSNLVQDIKIERSISYPDYSFVEVSWNANDRNLAAEIFNILNNLHS